MFKSKEQKQNDMIREAVRQGGQDTKIKNLFAMIREEAIREYYEDNVITVESFLTELFEEVMTTELSARLS